MKKRMLSLLLALCMVLTMLPGIPLTALAVDHTGGTVYFDNSQTKWTNNVIQLMVGNGEKSQGYAMTNVDGTDIYRLDMPQYSGATELAVFGTNTVWKEQDASVVSRKQYAANSTGVYTGEVAFLSGHTYMITSDGTNIVINEIVNVTFAANGGSGTMATATVNKGSTYMLPECTITAPDDQQFKAWSVGGEEKAVGAEITITADTTVTAVWEDVPSTTYTVTVSETENGKVEADKKEAAEGETVTLTVTPDAGYEGRVIVTNLANTEEIITPTKGEDGKYTFSMPAGDVTVTATFAVITEHTLTWSGYHTVVNTPTLDLRGYMPQDAAISSLSVTYGGGVLEKTSPTWSAKIAKIKLTTKILDAPATDTLIVTVNTSNHGAIKFTIEITLLAPPTYTVSIADGIENGTVSADKGTAAADETVTLTVAPAEGYELDTLTVDGENVTEWVVDSRYIFRMPAKTVEVSAVFAQELPAHSHCVCGSTTCSGDGHTNIEWTAWESSNSLPRFTLPVR